MPWYEYSENSQGITQPYVTVHLWHGTQRVKLLALVDSGADSSLIDVSLAEVLGLDRAEAQTVVGGLADGSKVNYLSWPKRPLELQFENDRFPFKGCFVEFPATGAAENLLGRDDFFQRYIVQFWDAAELMNIDLSPDYPIRH
jgi:hypothetical protein